MFLEGGGSDGLCDMLTRGDGYGVEEMITRWCFFFCRFSLPVTRISWFTNVSSWIHGEGNDAEREKKKKI